VKMMDFSFGSDDSDLQFVAQSSEVIATNVEVTLMSNSCVKFLEESPSAGIPFRRTFPTTTMTTTATNTMTTTATNTMTTTATTTATTGVTVFKHKFGNATKQTEILKYFSIDPTTNLGFVMFQAQIQFTRKNGEKRLRIISHKKSVTNNLSDVTNTMDIDVFGVQLLTRAGNMAREGQYSDALNFIGKNRSTILNSNNMTERNKEIVSTMLEKAGELEILISNAREREVKGESNVMKEYESQKRNRGGQRRSSRSRSRSPTYRSIRNRERDRDDSLSNVIYSANTWNSNRVVEMEIDRDRDRRRDRDRDAPRIRDREDYKERDKEKDREKDKEREKRDREKDRERDSFRDRRGKGDERGRDRDGDRRY